MKKPSQDTVHPGPPREIKVSKLEILLVYRFSELYPYY